MHIACVMLQALSCADLFPTPVVGIARGNTGAGSLGDGPAPFFFSKFRLALEASQARAGRIGAVVECWLPHNRVKPINGGNCHGS